MEERERRGGDKKADQFYFSLHNQQFPVYAVIVWCDSLEEKLTYLINIPVWSKLYHNFQLFHLHINWIVVFAKEHLYGKKAAIVSLHWLWNYQFRKGVKLCRSGNIISITLISWARMVGRFCTMRFMFRNATYWISGSAESNVTRGGAIFLQRFLTTSVLVISSICKRIIWNYL